MTNLILVVCLLTAFFVKGANALVEFTNFKCETADIDFADFEYCYLKSVNRTYKYMSLKVKLFQLPITETKVNIAIYKRLNGLKPFLYNVTFDACKFLRNPKSNQFVGYFFDFIKNHSNFNHRCPYDHDVWVDKVSTQLIDHRITKILPFPEGSYMFKTDWIIYGIKRVVVTVYFTLS